MRTLAKVDAEDGPIAQGDANVAAPKPGGDEDPYIRLEKTRSKKKIIQRTEIQLQDMEFKGELTLEADSVYGSVIAIPQIARSMHWNSAATALVFRNLMMLALNYFLQGSAIMYIGEESQIMDVLAGKMHLCDFAKDLEECPHGDHCMGPGGDKFTASSLYSFDIWSVRSYMRDTVKAALSGTKYEKAIPDVLTNFNSGEYGLENYWCRILACFLFMMNEVQDLFKTMQLISLLWLVPNTGQSWIQIIDAEDTKADPVKHSKFVIAGIPIGWKIFYLIFVVIPKMFLLWSVCWMGMRFLMETAGIIDLVLGAMTMDFILQLDELLYESLGSAATKHIMEELNGYVYDETDNEDQLSNERSGGANAKWGVVKLTVPRRLLFTLFALAIFVYRYYSVNCDYRDGMWVSQPMYLPLSSEYDFITFMKQHVASASEPYWTMPEPR